MNQSFTYPYSEKRINKYVQRVLRAYEDGTAQEFKILVDDNQVVHRTSDPDLFLNFLSEMDEDTRTVTIYFYKGGSQYYEKYVLSVRGESSPLNGPPAVQDEIQKAIEQERTRNRIEQLEKENQAYKEANNDWSKKFEELLSAHELLIRDFDELKRKKLHDGDWGELAGFFIKGLLQRNPEVLKKLPGGEVLSGIIDNKAIAEKSESEQEQEEDFEELPADQLEGTAQEPNDKLKTALNLLAQTHQTPDEQEKLAKQFFQIIEQKRQEAQGA